MARGSASLAESRCDWTDVHGQGRLGDGARSHAALGFRGTERLIDPQVYVPRSSWAMWWPDERKTGRSFRQFELYARLRPGATLDQARAQLQGLGADLQAKYPQANSDRSFNADWQAKMQGGGMKMIGIMVLGIAGCVLLIACANVANLLLAVNDARRREIAMRTALGASRYQLLRQLITEYSMLAASGVAGALGLAKWVRDAGPGADAQCRIPAGLRLPHRPSRAGICDCCGLGLRAGCRAATGPVDYSDLATGCDADTGIAERQVEDDLAQDFRCGGNSRLDGAADGDGASAPHLDSH